MTDTTSFVEVLARLLCAADVHAHGPDHPTWQQLADEPGRRIQDDYRKAARWLAPRLTVTQNAETYRRAAFREAYDIAHQEGSRLEEAAGIEPARGARSVAYLLRKRIAPGPTAAQFAAYLTNTPATELPTGGPICTIAIARVTALHQPHPEGGVGHLPDGSYGEISPACATCGTHDEYAVPWPCPTIRALDAPQARDDTTGDQR